MIEVMFWISVCAIVFMLGVLVGVKILARSVDKILREDK